MATELIKTFEKILGNDDMETVFKLGSLVELMKQFKVTKPGKSMKRCIFRMFNEQILQLENRVVPGTPEHVTMETVLRYLLVD